MKHTAPWTFLNIHREEYYALLRVRDDLASGKLVHNRDFNMAQWRRHGACGTCACVGGWMEIYLGVGKYDYSPALHSLFHPWWDDTKILRRNYENITPAETVEAIDNFLATGDDRWEEVLA